MTVVITGASSGIGRAAAIAFARQGSNLLIAARREHELEKVAEECRGLGVRCEVAIVDVRIAAQCQEMIQRAEQLFGRVDVLVNNAGFGIFDDAVAAKIDEVTGMLDTNFLGALQCSQAALPGMLSRGSGRIVNIASIAGIMGFQRMGGYCASKFAMVGMSEAMRDEVFSSGVRVSLVCPGTTETEFFQKAERGKMPAASRLVLAISSERVARAIVRVAVSGASRSIVPWQAALFMKVKEIFPEVAHRLMRSVSSGLEGRK